MDFLYKDSTTSKLVDCVLEHLTIDSPVRSLLKEGDFAAALAVPFPSLSSDNFGQEYLVYNLLRKNDFLDLGHDKVGNALEGFYESEASCRTYNQSGSCPSDGLPSFGKDFQWCPSVEKLPFHRTAPAVIETARSKIASLLKKFDWTSAQALASFSSGASSRLPRRSGAPYYKFGGIPEVTLAARTLATCDIWSHPLWREQMLNVSSVDPDTWTKLVIGSRVDTVPKTFKTDRLICIEPEMNMRLQRGIGKLIRRALRRVNINLNDQTRNQQLAFIGSCTGSLATIDLARASDSVAVELVRDLLPSDWFEALMMTRSSYTQLPSGEWRKLEKISSMGNGYTFELESLIFWALSSACIDVVGVSDKRLAVYGDDIVLHHSAAPLLIHVLEVCGFATNVDKTFVTGPFRESCGKHYYHGADVSPFYVKQEIESEDRFYWFLNSYRHWLLRLGLPLKGFLKARAIVKKALARMGVRRLCVVPPGFGFTSGLELDLSKALPFYSFRRGYIFSALLPIRRRHRPNGICALLAWFEQNNWGSDPSESILELMKGDTVYRRFKRCTTRWDADSVF